jgi:hypothetical protein
MAQARALAIEPEPVDILDDIYADIDLLDDFYKSRSEGFHFDPEKDLGEEDQEMSLEELEADLDMGFQGILATESKIENTADELIAMLEGDSEIKGSEEWEFAEDSPYCPWEDDF